MENIQHDNRRAENWIIYKNANNFIEKYSKYYKGTLYDLGCASKPYEAFLSDYSDNYISVERSNKPEDFHADIAADFNKSLPIDDEAADTLMAVSLMVELYDPQIFINESYRILKKDSYMILEIPFQWWVHKAPNDFYRYTPYGIRYLFEKAGFSEIKIEAAGGFFTMMVLKTNYFTKRRFVRGPKVLKWIARSVLIPFWYFGQFLAPYLDKLDNNWELETQAYWIVVRK